MTERTPIAYLDNAATSWPKAPGVAEAVARSLVEPLGSPGRVSGTGLLAADRIVFAARKACAELFGFSAPSRLIFTPGTTASLNLVLRGVLQPGAAVAVSATEHNAVMRPLRVLERELGLRVHVFACDRAGRPDPAAFGAVLATRPDLLLFTAASNVSGAIFPFAEMAADAARRTPTTLVALDAAQAAGELPLDLGAFPFDFCCVSPHKGLLAPAGLGLLFLGERAAPRPLVYGGTGSGSDSEEQPDFLPDRYESGTQNLPAVAGLLAALDYLRGAGIAALAGRRWAAAARLRAGLAAFPGLAIHGPEGDAERLSLLSVSHATVPLDVLARGLDRRGVICRAGYHCAPAAHRTLGTFARGGTLRFSPGPFSTNDELDQALAALRETLAAASQEETPW